MHMPISSEWITRLNLAPRIGKDMIVSSEQAATHLYAHVLQDALNAGVSGVFCVDDVPYAAVVHISGSSSRQELLTLYQILWNQGELDFLLLLHEDLVEVHSLRASPDQWLESSRAGSAAPPPTLLATLDLLGHTAEIESLLSGIESGRLLAEHSAAFAIDARVDATLIGDLDGARRCLLAEEGYIDNPEEAPQELIANIHEVLLQAMFLLYLNDRGIIGTSYIQAHTNRKVEVIHDLLRLSPQDFSLLLDRLDLDFNGGLFTAHSLWTKHARTMADFLEGMYSFDSGQHRLLRVYRFDHIPVELLSEVYDRFLHSEGNKKAHGAYYTPRRLAALVVEQAWDGIKTILDSGRMPKILDPACGSGIFLASLFQRIASYLTNPSWEDLKQLATCLHGLDINETAVRISAFSLSLALLNRRQPKELQKHIAAEGKILPELLGSTLLNRSFFKHPVDVQYDCIIGNPPWGLPKQLTKTEEESWVVEAQNGYPDPPQRERAWPFIWKSLEHLPIQGMLTLLLPSTGFFLNEVTSSLTRLLDFVHFHRLIDLSDLRHVLFKNAIFPACIFHATRENKKSPHNFAYICPKADLNAVKNDRILLAHEDLHQVSASYFAKNSVLTTQRLMWASPLERNLLAFLDTLPTLQNLPLLETRQARKLFPENPHPDWGMGKGFQSYKGKNKNTSTDKKYTPPVLSELSWMPHAITKNISPWVQPRNESWQPYGTTEVLWKNYSEGFTAPHIVMPRSVTSARFKACYSEYDFSFNDSSVGITVPKSDQGRALGKFLTAFLNSSFMAWFAGTLGLAVNRPRFITSDLLSLVFPRPEDLPDPQKAQEAYGTIVLLMDSLMQQAEVLQKETLRPQGKFPTANDIHTLDSLVFSYLGLRPEEISAIEENINFVRKAAQPAKRGKLPELWHDSDTRHWKEYCQWLATALTTYMQDDMRAVASVCAYSRDIVVVRVTRQGKHPKEQSACVPGEKMSSLNNLTGNILKQLEKPLGGNIYLQRCAMVFTTQEIYLLKPRQRRFWLTGAAYADADRIMGHLLHAADKGGEADD